MLMPFMNQPIARIRPRPYPSASGSPKCCSGEGGSLIEHFRYTASLGRRRDRLSSLFDRVPATLRRRGGMRAVSDRDALAGRVCLPGLQLRQGLAAGDQGLDIRVRRLWSPDFGHCRNHHASLQAAADRLVLGRLSDGHPLQRDLGAATAASARFGLL